MPQQPTRTNYLSMSSFFSFLSLFTRLSIRMSLQCASQFRCILFIACDRLPIVRHSCCTRPMRPTLLAAHVTDRSLFFSLIHQRIISSPMATRKIPRRAIEWVAVAVRHYRISSAGNNQGKVILRLSRFRTETRVVSGARQGSSQHAPSSSVSSNKKGTENGLSVLGYDNVKSVAVQPKVRQELDYLDREVRRTSHCGASDHWGFPLFRNCFTSSPFKQICWKNVTHVWKIWKTIPTGYSWRFSNNVRLYSK